MLEQFRKEAGFGQAEAAEALGMTDRTLRRYERGHFTPPEVVKSMADTYGNQTIIPCYCLKNCACGGFWQDFVGLAAKVIPANWLKAIIGVKEITAGQGGYKKSA